jgi:hypothetical protein
MRITFPGQPGQNAVEIPSQSIKAGHGGICHPSHMESITRKIGFYPGQPGHKYKTFLKKYINKKGMAYVGRLPTWQAQGPVFKPRYHPKKFLLKISILGKEIHCGKIGLTVGSYSLMSLCDGAPGHQVPQKEMPVDYFSLSAIFLLSGSVGIIQLLP